MTRKCPKHFHIRSALALFVAVLPVLVALATSGVLGPFCCLQ
jgi:hypothetical protein